jgi:hypothetical protein
MDYCLRWQGEKGRDIPDLAFSDAFVPAHWSAVGIGECASISTDDWKELVNQLGGRSLFW